MVRGPLNTAHSLAPAGPARGSSPSQPEIVAGVALCLSRVNSCLGLKDCSKGQRNPVMPKGLESRADPQSLPLRTPSPSYESSYQALGWVLSLLGLLFTFINNGMTWILSPPFQKEKTKARELNWPKSFSCCMVALLCAHHATLPPQTPDLPTLRDPHRHRALLRQHMDHVHPD